MKQRGRKSTASLELISRVASTLDPCARLNPARELTAEEREIWVAVVNDQPADWFSPSTAPLLSQYCRHIADARRLAEVKEKALTNPNLTIEDQDRILRMQERESRIIVMLATQMRLSQQSTTNHRGNKKTTIPNNQPWQETA